MALDHGIEFSIDHVLACQSLSSYCEQRGCVAGPRECRLDVVGTGAADNVRVSLVCRLAGNLLWTADEDANSSDAGDDERDFLAVVVALAADLVGIDGLDVALPTCPVVTRYLVEPKPNQRIFGRIAGALRWFGFLPLVGETHRPLAVLASRRSIVMPVEEIDHRDNLRLAHNTIGKVQEFHHPR